MPNYVKCSIHVAVNSEKKFQKICSLVDSNERIFDFNNIIPMPNSLNIEASSYIDIGKEYFSLQSKKDKASKDRVKEIEAMPSFEHIKDITLKAIANYKKYGCETWYDWCNKNWNTKWNAIDSMLDDRTFTFQTAWSFPANVIKTLSKAFPKDKFEYTYADEDLGYNCGRGYFKNGKDFVDEIPSDEKERFAYEMWGYCYEEEKQIREE